MTTDTVEREAKLFEAGSYPDRGIEITEDDLDRIVGGTGEAPIRIEHTATPFDGALGVLRGIYRKGRELFGRLCFTRAAWELVRSADARRLSVAVRKDKSGIAEVSLVREPRIADAAVFGDHEVIRLADAELPLPTEELEGEPPAEPVPGQRCPDEAEHSSLSRREVEGDGYLASPPKRGVGGEVDHLVDQFKRQGKLVPASELFARAILRADEDSLITFGDSPTPISRVFRWFLESQPKVIEFSELAPASGDPFDEPELFAKLGITNRLVEKHRHR